MTESEAVARLSVALGESDPTPTYRRTTWETCTVCRATISPEMTPEDATSLCHQGPARANVSRSNLVGIPAAKACPYRPPNSFDGGGR